MVSTEVALEAGARFTAGRRRGAAFARLLRPATFRTPVLVLLAAGLGEAMGTRHVLGAVLLVAATYGVATTANDVADLEIDRANGRTDRPLVTGDLSLEDARGAQVACALVVVLAQLLVVQPLGLVVTAVGLGLGVAYSHPSLALQARGLWGTTLLAAAYFVLPVALAGAPLRPALVVALLTSGTAMVLHKDIADEAGDRLHGKATPLVRHGRAVLDLLAIALGALGLAAGLLHAGPGWWTAAAGVALLGRRPWPDRSSVAALVAIVLLAGTA